MHCIAAMSVLWSPFGPSYRFFHVECVEMTISDLPSLAPDRFRLYDQPEGMFKEVDTWGVMLWKWFECSGCIDVNKSVQYFEA